MKTNNTNDTNKPTGKGANKNRQLILFVLFVHLCHS
jgi:hypothetical protein